MVKSNMDQNLASSCCSPSVMRATFTLKFLCAGKLNPRVISVGANHSPSMTDLSDQVSGAVREGARSNAATSAAHAMQEKGTKWGSTLQQSIGEIFERQPLLLGAVGIAIGAGIAASVPATEAENKVTGGASDFVREAVSEKAAQVKEMADAAVHEAKAQGLTPEAAGGYGAGVL
jgi:hypothetical protein